MQVCNLTSECDNHVDQVIDFAIRMQEEARCVAQLAWRIIVRCVRVCGMYQLALYTSLHP